MSAGKVDEKGQGAQVLVRCSKGTAHKMKNDNERKYAE